MTMRHRSLVPDNQLGAHVASLFRILRCRQLEAGISDAAVLEYRVAAIPNETVTMAVPFSLWPTDDIRLTRNFFPVYTRASMRMIPPGSRII